jgi:GxxExxY protein
MNENDLSYLIRGAAFKVHTALGPGLLESVYEVALYQLSSLTPQPKIRTFASNHTG